MAKQLLSMPLDKRHVKESTIMDNLQSDAKGWTRYYAVGTDWVQRWLDYVQATDKQTAVHPGPIDNSELAAYLITLLPNQEPKGKS